MEKSWRSNQSNSQINNSSAQNVGSKNGNINEMFQLRDKSASLGNSIASASSRSTSCVPFTKTRIGSVKFDLSKFDNEIKNDKIICTEKEKNSQVVVVASVPDVDGSTTVETKSENKKNLTKNDSDEKNCVNLTSQTTNLSITELNKIKRNAFFNNMECCSNTQSNETIDKLAREGSSDRVKRVIENFKSEIINKSKKDSTEIEIVKSPGKVMELVENFEKKENMNPPTVRNKINLNLMGKSIREKNNLNKICDISVCNNVNNENVNDMKRKSEDDDDDNVKETTFSDVENVKRLNLNDKSSSDEEPFISTGNKNFQDVVESKTNNSNNNKFYNEINENNNNNNFDKTSFKDKNDISMISSGESLNITDETKIINSEESNQNEYKMESNKEEDQMSAEALITTTTNNNEKESFKPIPAQRKSKMTGDSNKNLYPLPPKPRTKLPNSSSSDDNNALHHGVANKNNEKPPEPPPRPDSTFLKLPTIKSGNFIEIVNKKPGKDSTTVEKGLTISAPLITMMPETPSLPLNLQPVSPMPSSVPSERKKTSKSSSSFGSCSNEKTKNSVSTLESLKAMLTLGRRATNVNSPRSMRKKNAMLASEW